MRRNNHEYKVCEKNLVKRKKNSKNKLEFMGSLSVTQINNNGTVRFQKVIINDSTHIWGFCVKSEPCHCYLFKEKQLCCEKSFL